jgi:hypothetical protein
MNKCIFTSFNSQIRSSLVQANHDVLLKLITNTDIHYKPLYYPHSNQELVHGQILDIFIPKLLEEYDNVLVIDIDCIPLSRTSLKKAFSIIEQGYLFGCAQRSLHINNNQHIYIGSPCIGFSKQTFNKLGSPSFLPTDRGDTAEELTYMAESNIIPLQILMPSKYESDSYDGTQWDLGTGKPKYGIGTTFVNDQGEEMFYHLFESRRLVHDYLFINKCKEVLKYAS